MGRKKENFGSIICPICGVVYNLKNRRDAKERKTCSMFCSILYKKQNGLYKSMLPKLEGENHPGWKGGISKKKTCKICSKDIWSGSINNICRDCFNKRPRGNTTFICEVCGKEKTIINHRYNNLKNKVCSANCSIISDKTKGNNKLKQFTCPICNKVFDTYDSQVHTDRPPTCSRICNGKFNIKISGISPGYIDGRTPLRKLIKGSNKYKEWRFLVINKFDGKCNMCKTTKNLHAHHKNETFSDIYSRFLVKYKEFHPEKDKDLLFTLSLGFRDFWEVEQGESLCSSCHSFAHHGKFLNGNIKKENSLAKS